VKFTSATELKSGRRLAERPHFRVLFGRARDRVSALCSLYQDGPLDIDFRSMGQRAADVEMTRCEVQWRDVSRRSSRTGAVHPLGGFVGEAEYEGELTEFVPILKAAEWTGVGRHTVWGKGTIEVRAS
jgi:CRISPR/Cas system endoribonuclease Cas6 (RAMP superfamily)